jgi:hypothetical protein
VETKNLDLRIAIFQLRLLLKDLKKSVNSIKNTNNKARMFRRLRKILAQRRDYQREKK